MAKERKRGSRGIVAAVAAVQNMDGSRNLVSGNDLMLYGVVDSYGASDTIRAVDVIDSLAAIKGNEVRVRINSPGGSVTEGLAIYNALRQEQRRVICIVDSLAASVASVIMCAGDEIVIAENASVMIHDPWTIAIGSADDMRSMADEIDRMKSIIMDIYEKRTGMDRAEIESMMKSETYLSASDAVERGFCDSIAPDMKVAACAPLDRERLARLLFAKTDPDGGNVPSGQAAPAAESLESHMTNKTPAAAGNGAASTIIDPSVVLNNTAAPGAAAPVDLDAVRAQAVANERSRVADIHAAVAAARLPATLSASLVAEGVSSDVARARVIDALAASQAAGAGADIRPDLRVIRDERETMAAAMTDALSIRLGERLDANAPDAAVRMSQARPFMDATLVDMAAERTGFSGRLSNVAVRENVIRNAFHTTSDFPVILENALNRALAARYALQDPTYRRIATQRTYMDFRDHISVRAGDFPQLQPVLESGEIKAGSFSESKEKTSVKAYGVRVGFSRQLLVNDSLGAIQQVLNSRADAVARFEEETFYAMMLSASAAGPTLIETSRAVFNTTDKTLAGTPAAISVAAIGLGRAVLRKMKTIDGTLINATPSVLLVGPDKETEAQTITAPINATQASNVNPFSGKLETVVSAQITGNAWYLFVDPSQISNFEYGLLEGYGAPRMRMDEPFGTQGLNYSLEHDFGCGAVNYRGGYRNAGA